MERKRSDVKKMLHGAALRRDTVTDALVGSFFDEWARVGYAAISLERVARQVGVGKAALYRRWPDKKAMATDLLTHAGLTITDAPAQATLEADVLATLNAIHRVLRLPRLRRILVDLHAEIERTPELAAAIRPFQSARRARLNALFDRAIARGDLPATLDREAAADMLGAPIYWRIAVLGGRPGRRDVERLSRMVTAAIRVADAD